MTTACSFHSSMMENTCPASVTIRGNEWYDHAEERGGHAVSFVQRFYHLSYPEAVTMLLGG